MPSLAASVVILAADLVEALGFGGPDSGLAFSGP
jgi:hypothetical protein